MNANDNGFDDSELLSFALGPKQKKDRVTDKRQFKLEKINQLKYIPFLGGRPERDTAIDKNDQTDLTIILNTTNTIEEFIEQI